jgi:hypothetical protein
MDFEWGEGWLGAFSLLLKFVGKNGISEKSTFWKIESL